MTRTARRVGLALLAAVAVSAVAWPVYGRQAWWDCLTILAPLGALTAVVADVLAARPARLGGLRRQMAAVAVLTAAQLAIGVALFAELMFVSRHDAFFMALVAGYAALIGIAAATLVSRSVLGDVEAVRGALARSARARATCGSPCAATTSSPRSPPTSRRWSKKSPARSAPGASSSPPSRTTSAHR
jgi:hypothetical protein